MNNNMTIYGGGIAGLSCAITLLKSGLSVTIIDENAHCDTNNQSKLGDDVNVFLIDREHKDLVERLLQVKFESVARIECIIGKDRFPIPSERFYFALKGLSKQSIIRELRKVVWELGGRFISKSTHELEFNSSDNVVLALGNTARRCDKRLFGWRFETHNEIPNKTVFFDISYVTDSYCYMTRIDNNYSIVLLSSTNLSDHIITNYYRQHLVNLIGGSQKFSFHPFEFQLPIRHKNPYQKNTIGTMRGINDPLFYFGFSDSMIDGINIALWKAFPNYNERSFLKHNLRKCLVLNLMNCLKNLFHMIGRKDVFAKTFLSSRLLTNSLINLASASFSNDLTNYIKMINMGYCEKTGKDVVCAVPSKELAHICD